MDRFDNSLWYRDVVKRRGEEIFFVFGKLVCDLEKNEINSFYFIRKLDFR